MDKSILLDEFSQNELTHVTSTYLEKQNMINTSKVPYPAPSSQLLSSQE